MHTSHRTGKRPELIRQFDEWVAAHWHRLLACAAKNADERTDVSLLLTDTLKKVAGVFCNRSMSEELLIRYTMRCLRNAARQVHHRNLLRSDAETRYGERESLYNRQSPHGQSELHATLLDVLQQMPEPHGSIVKMRLWEELPFADIAKSLGLHERTTRRYYEAAITMLRTRTEQQSHG